MPETRPNLLFVRIENLRAVRDKIEAVVSDLVAAATRPASAQEKRHG